MLSNRGKESKYPTNPKVSVCIESCGSSRRDSSDKVVVNCQLNYPLVSAASAHDRTQNIIKKITKIGLHKTTETRFNAKPVGSPPANPVPNAC